MRRFLVVQLGAPLASFGDAPGNVERKTMTRPTRSALLGLAGAALGVDRSDVDGNAKLASSFSTASRTLDPGALLRDFHTYESVQRSSDSYRNRADALLRGHRFTSITRRDYRTGGQWQAAWCERPASGFSVDGLLEAFLKPAFVLFLGRKACSLSQPLAPRIIEAADLVEAFQGYSEKSSTITHGPIATDDEALLPAGGNRLIERRTIQDDPRDRRAWLFGTRYEWLFDAADGSGEAQ